MPEPPKYCAQCGKPVEMRTCDQRQRAVCLACDKIYYDNPLPVAAALVLNECREVLLVRRAREPHRGMWCLPMGFAEMGETIAEAARRELLEEAGISARVLRLVDADSYDSDHYGDLLIVTFELEKTGGEEQAGDDADDVGYFPLGRHPPLAFRSNEHALQVCTAQHLQDWEVQDSFARLAANEDKALLCDELVSAIERQADEIVDAWLADVTQGPTTPSYHGADREPLRQCAQQAVSQFERWLKGTEAIEEVRAFYRGVGSQRHTHGFRPHEVLSSLTLLKRNIWIRARGHVVPRRALDAYCILELDRLMATFFDRAAYHILRGFDEDG